jgi:hypothetical protein
MHNIFFIYISKDKLKQKSQCKHHVLQVEKQ